MPGYAFHKNTAEADQESSLIQAVYKYVKTTGDTSFLNEVVHGKTVMRRMDLALGYLMNFRYDHKYGMLWNAATADWGDVQFKDKWGVKFDEIKIFYHGGTAVAIEAGLLNRTQVLIFLHKMEQDVKDAGAQSIGLTMYPPYPAGSFANPGLEPYHYQNGGDWTWFGARMITDLVRYRYVRQAYRDIQPFVNRVVEHHGFYEWYTIKGTPEGSSSFKGSAGVLMQAIDALRAWARGKVK